MDLEHEYSLLGGINRAKVGRYIGLVAASVSSAAVFILLALVDLARTLNVPANLPPSVLSLVGAGSVFAFLYWIFNRYVWRWSRLSSLLKVPDLRGEWHCEGRSLKEDRSVAFEWSGTISIVQTWDKLRVRLRTPQSGSNSITAALAYDSVDGYRLLYNYRNEPRADQPELDIHVGFAELTFAKDLRTADGFYFNGRGRFTFGTMRLSRA
jgi:hypothetical protein